MNDTAFPPNKSLCVVQTTSHAKVIILVNTPACQRDLKTKSLTCQTAEEIAFQSTETQHTMTKMLLFQGLRESCSMLLTFSYGTYAIIIDVRL